MSTKRKPRLHAVRKPANATELLQRTVEPYRNTGKTLAIARDDYSRILAAGKDVQRVFKKASRTGREFFLMQSPSDGPTEILIV